MTQTNHAHQASALAMHGLPLPKGPGIFQEMILVHW
jgi:hypothetical protein